MLLLKRLIFNVGLGICLSACLASCDTQPANPPANSQKTTSLVEQFVNELPAQALPGGDTTFIELDPLSVNSADAFSQPSGNLSSQLRSQFVVGNSFFTNPWVAAPASTAGRDGLGPLFNAAACQDCHIRDGRGHAPLKPNESLTSAVVRIARADGALEPNYGPHIQTRSLPGLTVEAKVRVQWEYHTETLPDGTMIELRKPQLVINDWAYGKPDDNLRTSLRVAPAMIGMGLLEAIPAADIEAYAQQQRSMGLNGTVQQLSNPSTESPLLGRFGWKATQPNVRHQSLDAFNNDIGITSSLFPEDACTVTQQAAGCADYPNGGEPELAAKIEHAVVVYARHLAPPARRLVDSPAVVAGENLFTDIGCAGCHKPSWQTAADAASPALANQQIWPYTDMLLHDMGEGLADGVIEHQASGRHWRTAPLWGLGHVKSVGSEQTGYLHDGRARTLSEAILWHDGEALNARTRWTKLSSRERKQILVFLQSL